MPSSRTNWSELGPPANAYEGAPSPTEGFPEAAMKNYEVKIPARVPAIDRLELSVRRRAAELSSRDPDRFFAVIRDADRREQAGDDPVRALGAALDAARKSEVDVPYPPDQPRP
jgi:hypothetical protein